MKALCIAAAAATLLASVLSGCGGGGGGDATVPSSNVYNVSAAAKNVLASANGFTVRGQGSDGLGYTAQISYQPQAAAVFPVNGRSGAVSRQSLTLTRNSTPTSTSSSVTTLYYDAATGLPFGSVDSDGTCTLTSSSALPTSANVGATGPLSTDNDLVSCAVGAASRGTITTTTWSLESASTTSGAFALLCENATTPATGSSQGDKISLCIEVNADGSIGSKLRLTVQLSSNNPIFSLTATNY